MEAEFRSPEAETKAILQHYFSTSLGLQLLAENMVTQNENFISHPPFSEMWIKIKVLPNCIFSFLPLTPSSLLPRTWTWWYNSTVNYEIEGHDPEMAEQKAERTQHLKAFKEQKQSHNTTSGLPTRKLSHGRKINVYLTYVAVILDVYLNIIGSLTNSIIPPINAQMLLALHIASRHIS